MDFKKVILCVSCFILLSSCYFTNQFEDRSLVKYQTNWTFINNTTKDIRIIRWGKGYKLFLEYQGGLNGKNCVYPGEFANILLLNTNNKLDFTEFYNHLNMREESSMKCDSITFESCDGSKVYHVWRTSLEENGEHPFYQEENWRYESTDNGYTSNWYYILTPEFLVE